MNDFNKTITNCADMAKSKKPLTTVAELNKAISA